MPRLAPSPRLRGESWGEGLLRTVMDALCCATVAGVALVLIAAVIPRGVFTRYVLNSAASWPEPMAILLMIVLTFFGSAACYRAGTHTGTHMSVTIEQVVREIWPFYGVMFFVLMLVTYIPSVSLWLPRMLGL